MVERIVIIAFVLPILFMGCGGAKSLEDPVLQNEGRILGFKSSAGKSLSYKQISERSFYFNFQGNGFSPRERIDGEIKVINNKATENVVNLDFIFVEQLAQMTFDAPLRPVREKLPDLDYSFTIFVNPAQFYIENNIDILYDYKNLLIDPYNTNLEGREISLGIDYIDGQIIDIHTLPELAPADLGMNKDMELVMDYGAIITPSFSQKPVRPGDRWSAQEKKTIEIPYGAEMLMAIEKKYELKDYVEYKGHRCAQINLEFYIKTASKGRVEDYRNELMNLKCFGTGKGKGKIYFDLDGFIIYAEYDWYIDINFSLLKDGEVKYDDIYTGSRREELELIEG